MCDSAYTKQYKRSRAATCTIDYITEVAALAPEDRLKGKSLDFQRKTRVSRRSVVIDSSPLMTSVERHLGRDRFK